MPLTLDTECLIWQPMHTSYRRTARKRDQEACRIIDALGGTAAVATLCEVKMPSVSGWRTEGLPKARRQYLQLLRPDVFKSKRRKIVAV